MAEVRGLGDQKPRPSRSAFPGGVAGSKARPAPHPFEEITNAPLPGSGAPRASHQSDPGPLAQDFDPNAADLAQPS